MSGGSYEYMMGVLLDEKNNPYSGPNITQHSFFNGNLADGNVITNGLDWPLEKYYDKYLYSTDRNNYARGILGDASKEIGPFGRMVSGEKYVGSWYENLAQLVYSEYTWVHRGGAYNLGTESGMFSFGHSKGIDRSDASFRVILAPI